MHFYSFNVGNYRRETNHLSLLEHGIYRSLIDTYYLYEKPLCGDINTLMRLHCVRTDEEIAAFKNVISDFFELIDGVYHHSDCDDLIAEYRAKSEKARQSAKRRWQKDAGDMPTQSDSNAEGMLTNNHKPITNNQTKTQAPTRPESVSEQVWLDFLAHRKRAKANLTQTALTGIINQAAAAGWSLEDALSECVLRNWVGFKADWVKGDKHGHQRNGERARSPADRYRQKLAQQESDGKAMAGNAGDLRPQVGEQLRIGANGELGEIIEGHFTAANSKGS